MHVVMSAGPEPVGPFELGPGENVIGRAPESAVCLPSRRVSRRHAVLRYVGGVVWIEDAGSANGVMDGQGRRIDREAWTPGAVLQVGDYVLQLVAPVVAAATADEEIDLEDDSMGMVGEDEEAPTNPGLMGSPPPFLTAPPRFAPPLQQGVDVEHSVTPALGLAVAEARARMSPPSAGALPPPPGLPGLPPPPGGLRGFGGGGAPRAPAPTMVPDDEPAPPPAWPPRAVTPTPPAVRPAAALPPVADASSASAPVASGHDALTLRAAWPILAGGVAVAAVGFVLLVAVAQVLAAGDALQEASLLRAEQVADSLGNRNAAALAEQRGVALDVAFAEEREGVRTALVTDARGTVLAPMARLRTSVAAHPAWQDAVRTRTFARAELADGTWEVVAPVRADPGNTGAKQVVGYAVLEVAPEDATRGLYGVGSRIGALVFAAMLAIGALGAAAWALVVRPLVVLRDEIELALRGNADTVAPTVRLPAMDALVHSVNRALARARRA